MKKYLIFKTSDMAYESTRVFADELGEGLIQCGGLVDYFDVRKDGSKVLEELPQKKYDAVIDFNSQLPQLITDDSGFDEYYLNTFKCPFINYILDHPMYHHKNLAVPLIDYRVICIDDTHKSYIINNYPHIKNVCAIPIGYLTESLKKEMGNIKKEKAGNSQDEFISRWLQRENRVLFTGTYLNPDDYLEIINGLPKSSRLENKKVIEAMQNRNNDTFEDIVASILDIESGSDEFRLRVQSVCFADIYVRARLRQDVLNALVNAEIPLTIYGEKYTMAKFLSKTHTSAIVKEQISYVESVQRMQDYRFMLNVMPWFKSGIHDRIVNGMKQGCLCITDTSQMLKRKFNSTKDYMEYSIKNVKDLPAMVQPYIYGDMSEQAAQMAWNGHNKVSPYSFTETAKKLLLMLT